MAAEVHLFPCLSDNFGALIHDPATGATAAIDVPDAEATFAAARAKGWTINHILVTHHHPDHVQGIEDYRDAFGAPVYTHEVTNAAVEGLNAEHLVTEGDTLTFGDLTIEPLLSEGHFVRFVDEYEETLTGPSSMSVPSFYYLDAYCSLFPSASALRHPALRAPFQQM